MNGGCYKKQKDFTINTFLKFFEWYNTKLFSPWPVFEYACFIKTLFNENLFTLSSDINPFLKKLRNYYVERIDQSDFKLKVKFTKVINTEEKFFNLPVLEIMTEDELHERDTDYDLKNFATEMDYKIILKSMSNNLSGKKVTLIM